MSLPKETIVHDLNVKVDLVASSSSSEADQTLHEQDAHPGKLEEIRTVERVGTDAQYYEKGGLRTEGDGLDHDGTHHKLNSKLFLALVAMSFLWTGSQIPLYMFGGVLPDIYGDIRGYDRWIWLAIGYLIPNAALCPFVGALSDLFGRKYVAIVGQVFLIVGPIVTATANVMNVAIGGQVISGIGAGLNELIALAATAEMVPTAKRGTYVSAVVFTILPFAPSVLYAQLITRASSWRYTAVLISTWNLIGLLLVVFCYFEPPRSNSLGYTKRQILSRVDYIGGLLSIGGVMCFMMGMQWGAEQYATTSPHSLVPLILGIVLIIAFFIYEVYFARYPMCPPRVFSKAKRSMIILLAITFLSGANFFAMITQWPTETYNVYGNDRIGIGLRALPIGFGILTGAVVSLCLIPLTKGRIQYIMIFFTALMTAGTGSMAVATPDNLKLMYALVTIACVGVGGIIAPCSLIAQIISPDDLIATVTAITLALRYVGGAIGFTIYYNVFIKKLIPLVTEDVAIKVVVFKLGYLQGIAQGDQSYVRNLVTAIAQARYKDFEFLARAALVDPSLYGRYTYEEFTTPIIRATEIAFSQAYRWPYYVSIIFGALSFILALFLEDIKPFMDDHIAVPQSRDTPQGTA